MAYKTIAFHQIYFKEEQKEQMFPWATPYFNDRLTPFFENTIIAELVPHSEAEFTAVCSWNLRRKMRVNLPPRRELTQEVLQTDYDVLSFTKNTSAHDTLAFLEAKHEGSIAILKRIFDKVGRKFPSRVRFPIYQNAFCARTDIYQRYVSELLLPAIWMMSNDEEMKDLLWTDAGYTISTLGVPVDFDRIEKFLGVRFYPKHPFICERLFSMWLEGENLNVQYI